MPPNVGGAWEGYKVPAQLSHIPLHWIVREATKSSSIVWDKTVLKRFKVEQPKGGQELAEYVEQERAGALAPLHSAYTHSLFRWFLKFLPLLTTIQLLNFDFTILFPNLFRARKIREPTEIYRTKVHSSVKTRLKHFKDPSGQQYRNAAQWDPSMTEFVDEWALPGDVA